MTISSSAKKNCFQKSTGNPQGAHCIRLFVCAACLPHCIHRQHHHKNCIYLIFAIYGYQLTYNLPFKQLLVSYIYFLKLNDRAIQIIQTNFYNFYKRLRRIIKKYYFEAYAHFSAVRGPILWPPSLTLVYILIVQQRSMASCLLSISNTKWTD